MITWEYVTNGIYNFLEKLIDIILKILMFFLIILVLLYVFGILAIVLGFIG